MRLDALSDDTRLRILKLLSEHGELASQDIMTHLELSQSATSRHLKQLSMIGYLQERRCNGAKCYALNPEWIKETLQAVTKFLIGEK
ncbi:MAG: winged helix-turn-helix transcriptional regulator [Anaerolineae bacterium]|nr:winged helix-turn-helix transcriptional regulator [Anaerolineae bacterium]